jgi:hypothetical protein
VLQKASRPRPAPLRSTATFIHDHTPKPSTRMEAIGAAVAAAITDCDGALRRRALPPGLPPPPQRPLRLLACISPPPNRMRLNLFARFLCPPPPPLNPPAALVITFSVMGEAPRMLAKYKPPVPQVCARSARAACGGGAGRAGRWLGTRAAPAALCPALPPACPRPNAPPPAPKVVVTDSLELARHCNLLFGCYACPVPSLHADPQGLLCTAGMWALSAGLWGGEGAVLVLAGKYEANADMQARREEGREGSGRRLGWCGRGSRRPAAGCWQQCSSRLRPLPQAATDARLAAPPPQPPPLGPQPELSIVPASAVAAERRAVVRTLRRTQSITA